MLQTHDEIFLVSACLTGLCTRYDGLSNPSPECMNHLAGHNWIPICPEQLGGLPTPRTPADMIGGDGYDVLAGRAAVVDRQGLNVTSQFIKGAHLCLDIAQAQKITAALLKRRSPSCGLTTKIGVTAALLKKNGLKVIEF